VFWKEAFDPARLDSLFEKTAESGYTRATLLFSRTTVRLMSEVVLGVSHQRHARPYQDASTSDPCERQSQCMTRPKGSRRSVSAEVVRDSARQLAPIISNDASKSSLAAAWYRVRILDGNHLSGTEHRIKELRRLRAAALPGQSLVILDPELMLMIDVLP